MTDRILTEINVHSSIRKKLYIKMTWTHQKNGHRQTAKKKKSRVDKSKKKKKGKIYHKIEEKCRANYERELWRLNLLYAKNDQRLLGTCRTIIIKHFFLFLPYVLYTLLISIWLSFQNKFSFYNLLYVELSTVKSYLLLCFHLIIESKYIYISVS